MTQIFYECQSSIIRFFVFKSKFLEQLHVQRSRDFGDHEIRQMMESLVNPTDRVVRARLWHFPKVVIIMSGKSIKYYY
jgi:hypothetical protein